MIIHVLNVIAVVYRLLPMSLIKLWSLLGRQLDMKGQRILRLQQRLSAMTINGLSE